MDYFFYRHGFCAPYTHSHLEFTNGIPCDKVYEEGIDYIYFQRNRLKDYNKLLHAINDAENRLEDAFHGDCTSSVISVLCHFYLPPCGNSVHFELPTSVCYNECEQLSQTCPDEWSLVQQKLKDEIVEEMTCSNARKLLDPLPHSCSNVGIFISCKFIYDIFNKAS